MLLDCNEPVMKLACKRRSKALQTTNFLTIVSNSLLKFETQNLLSVYTTT